MDDPRNRFPQSSMDPAAFAEAIAPTLAATVAQAVAQAMAQVLPAIMQPLAQGQADAVRAARSPIAESYRGDFAYHEQSYFRPQGQPLTPLKCPMFLGYWDDDLQKVIPGYPYLADEHGGCTEEERQILNRLTAGVFKARRRDGIEGPVRVEVRTDVDGSPMRLVVCVPKQWLSKELKNMIGGVEFLRQLLPRAEAVAV